jgi:ribonuclease HI
MIPTWKIYVNGSFNINESEAGIVFISPKEQVIEYRVCFEFLTMNNISEYEAFLTRLYLAEALNAFLL